MKLITKEIIKKTPKLYAQDGIKDATIYFKLFNPCGGETWYIAEMDEKQDIVFCYVTGLGEDEWGYSSLKEIAAIKTRPFGLGIERDLHFSPCKISEILKNA